MIVKLAFTFSFVLNNTQKTERWETSILATSWWPEAPWIPEPMSAYRHHFYLQEATLEFTIKTGS